MYLAIMLKFPSKHTHADQSVCFISKLSRRSISYNNTVSLVFCLSAPAGSTVKESELKFQKMIYIIRQMRCVSPSAMLTKLSLSTALNCICGHVGKQTWRIPIFRMNTALLIGLQTYVACLIQ